MNQHVPDNPAEQPENPPTPEQQTQLDQAITAAADDQFDELSLARLQAVPDANTAISERRDEIDALRHALVDDDVPTQLSMHGNAAILHAM